MSRTGGGLGECPHAGVRRGSHSPSRSCLGNLTGSHRSAWHAVIAVAWAVAIERGHRDVAALAELLDDSTRALVPDAGGRLVCRLQRLLCVWWLWLWLWLWRIRRRARRPYGNPSVNAGQRWSPMATDARRADAPAAGHGMCRE